MKKHLLLTGAVLTTTSFLLLSGFDSAETVESILEKSRAASADISSASYDIDMNADVTLDISSLGMTVGLSGSGEASVAAVKDPLALAFEGTFSGSAMGQSGQISVGTYLVTEEDGSLTVYLGSDGAWTKQTVPADEAEQYTAFADQLNVNYAEMPISFVLGDQANDVNGVECYQLTASLEWDDVKQILVWSAEQAMNTAEEIVGELETEPEVLGTSVSDAEDQLNDMVAQLDAIDAYVEGLKLNIAIDISCDTFETQMVYIDMDGSDWTNVIAFLTESGLVSDNNSDEIEVNLDVHDLHIAIASHGAVEEITVPEEITANAVDFFEAGDTEDETDTASGADTETEADQDGSETDSYNTNTMSYDGVTFTLDEDAFEYFYADENYLSGSLYEPYYSISVRVNEYTDTEERIREEQEWEAGYYAENYEKSAVSDVETGTYADGSPLYQYSVSYESTESSYAAVTYSVFVINENGKCASMQIEELGDTMEELTLTQEKVDEMISHLTIEW